MPAGGGGDRRDDVTASDAAAIRPFLGRPPGGPCRGPVPPATDEGSGAVRPYYLTRGRVASADDRVRVETVVVAVPGRAHRLPARAREHQQLIVLAAEPTSVVLPTPKPPATTTFTGTGSTRLPAGGSEGADTVDQPPDEREVVAGCDGRR